MAIEKIISGGQTGADRAALDAGLAAGFPVGGFCPAGRKAEDGEIPARYPLTEIEGGYRQRTKRNVAAADGTAIFYEATLGGGSELTLKFCMQQQKPYQLIDTRLVSRADATEALRRFVADNAITTLNVAGPRASSCPEIHAYVAAVIGPLLSRP